MRALALGAFALLAACYAPTYEGLLCGEPAEPCPDDYQCVAGMCRQDEGRCGDFVRSGNEACDDGNTMTETMCPYGTPTCNLCNADCTQALNLFGRYCGDRQIEAGVETCDDGNAMACGLCNADCTMALSPRPATGALMNVTSLSSANEGQYFGLFDGVLTNYQGFEIDYNGTVQASFIRIDMTAGMPGAQIANAINASALSITATDMGNGTVGLVNQLANGRGNGAIMTNIPAPFAVTGMSGGAASDCPQGVGCTSNGVCMSNSCMSSVCQ